MIEIMRTNNYVELWLAQSLLREAGIGHFVADQNMSVMEGSLGILPRRLMVDSDRSEEARALLREAGLDDVV